MLRGERANVTLAEGWDGNGESLLRGGWDRNGPLIGAERDGVVLVEPSTLAPVELDHGRLAGGTAGPLEL